MPYSELVAYLTSIGDSIETKERESRGARLTTANGTLYVCSHEGLTYDGHAWWPKWRWNRWT